MFGGEKMFKKIGALVLVVLLVSGSLVLISKESEVKAFEIEYLYVGEGKEHSTISSALENASDGDRILVSEGYYTESLILNKSIYLLGSGQERSAISGQNEPILLGVTADGCHISDLAFLGVEETEIGILLGSDANTVKNCRFHGIRLPLKLEGSSDNLIENNTFVYNGDPVSSDDDNRITTGLMAYWAMEDDNWIGASGEVRDSSGNDLHGTAMKGANLSKDGMFGRAGHFDGTDDYVDFDNVEPLNFGTGPFSASVWINMDPDAPYQVGNKIVQKRGGRDKSWGEIPGWMMAVQRLGSSVYVKNTGVDDGKGNSIELANREYLGPVGTWIHLVFTWDSNTARLFVNGGDIQYSRSNPNMGSIDNDRKATLGCHWNHENFQDQFFHGLIDEVRIYNRALGLEDIRVLYNHTSVGTIVLEDSFDNLLMNNSLKYNSADGIVLRSSGRNIAVNNTVLRNMGYAFVLDKTSDGNLVYLNEIYQNMDGEVQAKDDGMNNSWDIDGRGNYWSDWTEPDSDLNGIVDRPYGLDGFSMAADMFPLVHMISQNTGPRIVTADIETCYVGYDYNVTYQAVDEETDPAHLIWSVSTNATWMNISGSTMTGTPEMADKGRYWVMVRVSDGVLMDNSNFTLWVREKEPSPSDPEGPNGTQGEFDLDDLFPPLASGSPEYSVDENDEVDVDVQEDGRIEIHPRCEWDGSADIIVHEDTGGITRTIKIVEVGSENGKLHFPGSGDQILLAYVSPGSDLQPPYTYRWNIKNWGDVGSRQMLKLDLVPGDYLLTVEITDTMAKKVSGEFDISIGDDNRASESEPALTLGQVLYGFFFTSIMVMLAIVVITLIIIKNRQIQIGPKKQPGSAIDLAICDGGAVQWNERDGPSPGAPGGGPNNHPSHFQEFDHLVVGGILEDKQTPSNGPSHAPELHQGVFFGSLRREAIEWEGEAGMGMDDEQIRLALKRRLVDGDLSRKTYNKVLEKMQQQ